MKVLTSILVLSCLLVASASVATTIEVKDYAGSRSVFLPQSMTVEKANFPGLTVVSGTSHPVEEGKSYQVTWPVTCVRLLPGAALSLRMVWLDGAGRELGRVQTPERFQQVYAENLPHDLHLHGTAPKGAVALSPEVAMGGNPLTVTLGKRTVAPWKPKALFKGRYDASDPMPPREQTLAEMTRVKPVEASVQRRHGRPMLVLDGQAVPYKAYKGATDYGLTGEQGCNLVVTHGHGAALYWKRTWDKPAYEGKGTFNFKRLEDNLLRIYAANPKARVVVTVDCDPDDQWLTEHPENILLDEQGRRGIASYCGFKGFGGTPDPAKEQRWAWTYASEACQQHIMVGLRAMGRFLRQSPAGNIVAGFSLAGGHDGQFVQWKYGDETAGHADYSESFQQALRVWLRERYASDEALQRAWGQREISLKTARVFTGEEWRSKPYFTDNPGLDRKIVDCRTFLSISTARMLRRFGRVLEASLGRPCVIQSWYSSPLWRQTSRLAVAELCKGGVDIVAQVTDYAPPRLVSAPGGAANYTVADSNLRNMLYVQELDHRTWRTQEIGGWDYTAYPKSVREFETQIIRDAGAVLAAGGAGFYFYDMFGSWYHDSQALAILKVAYGMADWAQQYGHLAPRTQVAVFMDEPDRLHGEGIPNGGCAIKSLRMSGLTPDIYMLDDILNDELPSYQLYLFLSPMTIQEKHVRAMKRKAFRPDSVVILTGNVGIGGPYGSAMPVLQEFGLGIQEKLGFVNDVVVFDEGVHHPLSVNCRGRLGTLGVALKDREVTFLRLPSRTVITDSQATVLGRWAKTGEPGLAVKRDSLGRTLVYTSQIAGLTPQLIANAARQAGIEPPSEPGNAVYVGHGIAVGHRLSHRPIVIRFSEPMDFFAPSDGRKLGTGKKHALTCQPGEAQAVLYRPAGKMGVSKD